MAARQLTPSSDHSRSNNVRKRVCKACDRCRLKKSKCDGNSPCLRCQADNAICVFGERKKTHDKVYPKGYVEILEQQQTWLVHGLQELYRRSIEGEGWPGGLLSHEPNGHPLTHDLLTRLGALDHSKGEGKRFEENPEVMQHDLCRNAMTRQDSTDGSATDRHSPHCPVARSRSFSSHSQQTMPPTSPAYSPSNRAATMQQQIKAEPTPMAITPTPQSQYALSMRHVLNPLTLQGAPQWTGNNGGFNLLNEMDLMSTGDDINLHLNEPIPSPIFHLQMPMTSMPSDYDDLKEFLNPNPTEVTLI